MHLYYRLTKPGIVYGNAITAVAGFLFASGTSVDVGMLLAMLVGLSLTIAGSCVVNNVMDREIDAHMERTKERAIPTGRIPISHALVFAGTLLLTGLSTLLFLTNFLAFAITFAGVIVYVGLYTPAKSRTVHSTLIGAVAGAVPPVVGYTAASGVLDAVALLLFLILVAWQMVHFFAIAIFRVDEYRAAGVPVMAVSRGIQATKILMIIYTLLFMGGLYALYIIAGLGLFYALIMGILSLGWLTLATIGLWTPDDTHWAKRMFLYSIVILLIFSIVIAVA